MKSDTPEKLTTAAAPFRHKQRIALVLQGGGALGAYQAGVFQAMHEHDLAPDWVVGTSIGAINAALIAGNKPADRVARLRQFWDGISHPDAIDMKAVLDPARRANTWLATVDAVTRGVKGFFSPRAFSLFSMGVAVPPDEASFYDTHELADTLRELVDFDYLHSAEGVRLTVNAVKVTSGQLVSFDSDKQPIEVDHIMASGALPPGFPPVRIAGELYWDGGLYSNTPLETVLSDRPSVDTLCFMVDLWNPIGPEPTTFDEVQTRQKDVMFASRSVRHIEAYRNMHRMQCLIRSLYDQLPERSKGAEGRKMLQEIGCSTTMHIVRIPYGGQDWHMAAKDINFSKGSIEWRWEQGYKDASRAIEQAGWMSAVDDAIGVVVHELQPTAIPTRATFA
ncbi:MAG: patatin-like phospholipase family protein [Herminiimonas sp.]|nr:patatin-like phospholipase family protein [Herminiimonas sp.]